MPVQVVGQAEASAEFEHDDVVQSRSQHPDRIDQELGWRVEAGDTAVIHQFDAHRDHSGPGEADAGHELSCALERTVGRGTQAWLAE